MLSVDHTQLGEAIISHSHSIVQIYTCRTTHKHTHNNVLYEGSNGALDGDCMLDIGDISRAQSEHHSNLIVRIHIIHTSVHTHTHEAHTVLACR